MRYKILSLLFSLLTYTPTLAQASENTTMNWNSIRSNWENTGIFTEIVYKLDVISNISGGKKEGTRALDNLDIIFNFDGKKIVNIEGLSAKIHFLNNFGGKPNNNLTDSAQGIDNIEVTQTTAKLYQAYIEQNLFADKLSILAGLYDLNSEFYVTDASALFLHPSFGIGTDFSQSGQNGPSIFPTTSIASRIHIKPGKNFYIQTVILDGVSGNPDNHHGTHIEFGKNDGWLLVSEIGYTPENTKLTLGNWYYTKKFDHQTLIDSKGNPVRKHSNGIYIIGEKQLYAEGENKDLTAFARLGFANSEVNQFDYAWSVGVVYTGLFPMRDEGQLGFGITGAHNSSEFKQASLNSGATATNTETSFELTYSDKILPWLSLQPDLQYVINPNTDKTRKNAVILGTRFTIDF